MKHQNYVIGVSISLLTAIVCIPIIVGAAPSSVPPTGVTDAKFNSVDITNNADVGGDLNADGSIISNGDFVQATDGANFATLFPNGTVTSSDGTHYTAIYPSGGIWVNASDTGGMTLDKVGDGGLTINSTTGGIRLNATSTGGVELNSPTGGIVNNWTGQPVKINDNFSVAGRTEMLATTDASGTTGTGVLEIGGGLRMDGNEIITDTNSTLYLQNDNNGDFRVDSTTLYVDSSANRVGINDSTPSYPLDVAGDARVTGRLRADTVGGYGWGAEYVQSIADGGNYTFTKECPENDEVAISCGYETRYFNSTTGCTSTVAKAGAALDVVVYKQTPQWDYSTPGKCEITFKNNTGVTRCGVLFMQCYNPND